MDKQEIREVVTKNKEWIEIEGTADHMMSFTNSKKRLRCNVYLTTGTVTFQSLDKKYDKGETYRGVLIDELRIMFGIMV